MSNHAIILALLALLSGCVTNKRCIQECKSALETSEPFIRADERMKCVGEYVDRNFK
jgi:hypothetical protein